MHLWIRDQYRRLLEWLDDTFVIDGKEPAGRDSYPIPLDIF